MYRKKLISTIHSSLVNLSIKPPVNAIGTYYNFQMVFFLNLLFRILLAVAAINLHNFPCADIWNNWISQKENPLKLIRDIFVYACCNRYATKCITYQSFGISCLHNTSYEVDYTRKHIALKKNAMNQWKAICFPQV